MRSSRSFTKLLGTAQRRLGRLKGRAVLALQPTTSVSDRDKHLAYVVIETQNLWANFVRSYLLSCLLMPRRVLGGRVTLTNAAIRSPGDLLLCAAQVQKGPLAPAPTTRREEPSWHDVQIFLRTCQTIGCSHLTVVQLGLSVQTRIFYDLPAFRNFYSHRNEESAERALGLVRRQYLITKAKHPTEALATSVLLRPQALVLDWLDELDVVMALICE